jgi:hypothetical protein
MNSPRRDKLTIKPSSDQSTSLSENETLMPLPEQRPIETFRSGRNWKLKWLGIENSLSYFRISVVVADKIGSRGKKLTVLLKLLFPGRQGLEV